MHSHPVSDIMTRSPIHAEAPAGTVRDACQTMAKNNIHSVLVKEEGRLIGIFTGRDVVRRVIAPGHDPATVQISEVMTPDPDTIRPDTTVAEAIRMMDEFGYSHLPVVEAGAVVGILSIRDLPLRDLDGMRYELEERHSIAERAW